MLRAQSATVSLAPNKRGQPPPWLTIIISVFVGYFLCWASQARHQPRRVSHSGCQVDVERMTARLA